MTPLTPAQIRVKEKARRARERAKRAMSPTAMRRRCDRLWSAYIRADGKCEAAGHAGIACSDQLQAAHIISRKYLGTRWNPANGLCLCSAHHSWFTHRELQWQIWRERNVGDELYSMLRDQAIRMAGPPNYAVILAMLEELTAA